MNWKITLTPREQQIAQYIARGATVKEVAHKLDISPATANNHKSAIYDKIDAHNLAEFTVWWMCSKFGIDPSTLELKRKFGALVCIIIITLAQFYDPDYQRTARRARRARRKDQSEWITEL